MRRLSRSIAPAFLAALGSVWACSNNDNTTPAPGGSGSAGTATGGGGGGSQGDAGGASTPGGDSSGGAGALGGATTTDGGVANQGGSGGGETGGGAGPEGGAPPLPAGGAGGSEGTDQGPPDLITSSGGPWPDSLTGACATPSKAIACPQTGDAFFGQDGTYRTNVPSYTATATTMKDSVTGLVWQLAPEQLAKTQAEAAAYCDTLQLGAQTDWRLPTRLEYVSVLDEGMGSGYGMPPAVSIDTTGAQWTASATGTAADQFFLIDDQFGAWTVGSGATPHGARCVRGAVAGGSLQVETDVVTDNASKLVWQVTELDETSRNWQEALDYCETLSHAGKEDWRLPSIKELATLVDEAATVAPAIRAEYGASAPPQYWSSTPAPSFGSEGFAFTLETGVGYSPSQKMTDSAAAARCVRSQD
jgi:Protein of unknown function (DUF1566)